jgi:uncharacterized repeat protein (TIGR03803 family)
VSGSRLPIGFNFGFNLAPFFALALLVAGNAFAPRLSGQEFDVLHTFLPADGFGTNPSQVLQGADGALYGVAQQSGGSIFRISTDGTGFVVLHNFGGSTPSGLVQGVDGVLYGTIASAPGSLFRMNADGSNFAIIHAFGGPHDGFDPYGLLQGIDGRLYGSTNEGNVGASLGVIYAIGTDGGGYTVLHTFDGTTGANPTTALIQGSDRRLYGVTQNGGVDNLGVVYGLNADGTGFAVLHSFTNTGDGSTPLAPLVQGFDSRLYGGTISSRTRDGKLFSINPDGTAFAVIADIPDIEYISKLVQGRNNVIYGATSNLGQANFGTLFQVNTDGTNYQVGHVFLGSPDGGVGVSLIQGADGRFYGTAALGGAVPAGIGTVFAYTAPATPIITSPASASGRVSVAFTYSITASAPPIVAYAAAFLPVGLSLNQGTGVISGVPAHAGAYKILVAAANAYGLDVASVILTIGK